jgi:ribosomal protein L40E
MPEDKRTIMAGQKDRLEPAFAALARIDELHAKRDTSNDDNLSKRLIEDSLGLCDQALRVFRRHNETWLDSWAALHKAALLTELAHLVDPAVRQVHTRTAVELVQKSMQQVENISSPDLRKLAWIYNSAIETIFRIRVHYDEGDKLEALDELIRTLGSRLGEIQALDLSLRSEAYDLLFSAQILDSMIMLEQDPAEQMEMRSKSKGMALDAYDRLRISSPSSLAPLVEFLDQVNEPLNQEPESRLSICPRCGAENSKDAMFCNQCGTTMARSTVQLDDHPENICRRCEHTNRVDALFCTYCGARLNREGR